MRSTFRLDAAPLAALPSTGRRAGGVGERGGAVPHTQVVGWRALSSLAHSSPLGFSHVLLPSPWVVGTGDPDSRSTPGQVDDGLEVDEGGQLLA
jgi:hypothetical protein